ncbi:MAG: hypothetical protein JSW34_00140 [Candidatus Zixiibacteriota bacterium]|nr:MAG: hypothetical protein JSW34_00140 [candidate division Zixibacteria bacterium]
MSGLKNLSVDFLTPSPLMVVAALVALVVLAVYLYRTTNPPLRLPVRVVLILLRIAAVLVVVLALSQPVISIVREFDRPVSVGLLCDQSASMERLELGLTRQARRDSLLSSSGFARFSEKVRLTSYYFGGNVTSSGQDVDRNRTAMGDALDYVSKPTAGPRVDHWILFSDGRSNSGRSPSETVGSLAAPVSSVNISAGPGQVDIGVTEVNYSPVMFAGQSSEIEIGLSWHGAEQTRVTVELSDSRRVVEQSRLDIRQPEGLARLNLGYTPDRPGTELLRVAVSAIEGEENSDNNRRSFAVKVLKSRFQVLLVSGRPDHEVGFLRRFLQTSDKYDVELLVTGSRAGNLAGRFPVDQAALNRYDLVVLHDPDPRQLEPRGELIRSYLSDKGGALWLLMGEQFSREGPSGWLSDLLPFSQSGRRNIEYVTFHARPSEANLFHPALRLADNRTEIRRIWAQLPPFEALVRCDRLDPEAVVLAEAVRSRDGVPVPVIGYRRVGSGKVMACAALPFWPWGFVSRGFGDDDSNYGKFIEGTVSWLTVSEDLEPVRMLPEKEVFTRHEPIRFDGYAFDLGYRPLPGVTGVVKLKRPDTDQLYEVDFVRHGEGSYRAFFYNVAPGQYAYQATFYRNEEILKETDGDILVQSFSLEEFDQSADPAALRAISRLSGGDYVAYAQFDDALDKISTAAVRVREKDEFILHDRLWLLLILIVALSAEWLIRKIHQLL